MRQLNDELNIDRHVGLMSIDELHEQARLCAALLACHPRYSLADLLLTHARDIQVDLYFRESRGREPGDLTDDELTECIELVFALSQFRPRRKLAVPLLDYLHALSHVRDERAVAAPGEEHPQVSGASGRISYGMRRIRLERGMSLAEAARVLKCSVSQLSRVERGQRWADPKVISAAYEVPVSELLVPCPQCRYAPPPGFTCRECGATTPAETTYRCACGAGFTTADDLDSHLLAAMGIDGTPGSVDWTDPSISPASDAPGIDGKQHYEVTRDE